MNISRDDFNKQILFKVYPSNILRFVILNNFIYSK